MKRKIIFLLISLAVIIAGIYFQNQAKIRNAKVSGIQTYQYDKTVKTIEGQPIKVAYAIDGDTIVLVNGDHMRYVGIDTPEEFDQRKPVQCFAKEAAERNKQLVDGQTIIFRKDMDIKDKYDRWLGFVYLVDGTFVNLELVKQGYAFAYPYPPDISKASEFKAAEDYARTNKLGLWNGQCIVTILSGGHEQTNAVE